MRIQGQARFPHRDEETGRLVPNSENAPHFGPGFGIVVGVVVGGCMWAGFFIAVHFWKAVMR